MMITQTNNLFECTLYDMPLMADSVLLIYIQRLKHQSTINLTGCWIVTVLRYHTRKINNSRLNGL